ncbi:hypothetical protein VTK56DRAFT_6307 [Thermocarpiscus australiensis]
MLLQTPNPRQDINELFTIVENSSEAPCRGATRPQTMVSGRAERREKNLDALRRGAVIIDLTNDDASPSPATTRPQTMASRTRRSPAKHRADLEALERPPAIDLTDDDGPLWEPLEVYPTLLALKDGRYTNNNGGIDPHSIAEVALKPSNGYPLSVHLFRDSGDGFTGKYGEDETGIISPDLREMKAMIQQEPRVDGFWPIYGLLSS